MFEALTGQEHEFFKGVKISTPTATDEQYFQYELLSSTRKTYGQQINNLIVKQGRTTIKTNWNLDWEVRQCVIDNNGKMYKIQEVETLPLEINPQVNRWLNNADTDYVLSLVEISNPMER